MAHEIDGVVGHDDDMEVRISCLTLERLRASTRPATTNLDRNIWHGLCNLYYIVEIKNNIRGATFMYEKMDDAQKQNLFSFNSR